MADPVTFLRTAVAVLILFLLPGAALTWVLWPRGAGLDPIDRVFLSIALSVAVTIAVGGLLGFLPHGDEGFFQVPLLVAILLVVTIAAGLAGRRRQARVQTDEAVRPPPIQVAE